MLIHLNPLKSITFFILLGFPTLHELSANSVGPNNQDVYTISIDENQPKLARVNYSFYPTDSLLYMGYGASRLPDRWATFVSNLKAVNASGKTLEIDKKEGASWIIKTRSSERVNLSYEVNLTHEDHHWSGGIDGAAYAKEWGVFYTGRSLFILNGEDKKDISIYFSIPSDWKVTSSFYKINGNSKAFSAKNSTALWQAMFFTGKHEELVVKREGFELVFALGGENIMNQKEDFKMLAEGVFDYYIDLMGGLPKPPPGSEFKKSVVIVNPGKTTDGEVIGNNISILIEENGDEMSEMISRFIFAHEFFHLWNGKSFAPVGDNCEWFKEGFTNYYTLKALVNVNFLNEESFFSILNSLFYQRYSKDDGIGSISMTQGEAKHDHWGIIYGGGLFAGMAQDIIIRKETNNEKSLDDLMLTLFKKYGGTNNNYTIEELQKSMEDLSGLSQDSFFKTYVQGSDLIPIEDYLQNIGLEAKLDEGQLHIQRRSDETAIQKHMISGVFGRK